MSGSDETRSAATPTEEAQVAKVVEEYLAAQARLHTNAACERLSESGVRQLVRFTRAFPERCEVSLPYLEEEVGKGALERFSFADVERVEVRGSEARYQVSGPDLPDPQPGAAVKEDGVWKVSRIPGF